MSTSANLPAGFTITTISGVRCTAVPKTATTLSNVSTASNAANSNSVSTTSQAAAAATTSTRQTTSSTSTTSTSTSSTSTSTSTSSTSTSTTSTSSSSFFTSSTSSFSSAIAAAPAVVTAPSVSTTSVAPEISTTTSIAQSQQSINSTPQVTSTESSTTTPASPAPSSTITPATTPIPIALSDTLPSSSVILSSSDDSTAHTSASHSSGDGTVHSTTSAAAAGAASTSIGGTGTTGTADSSSSSSNLSSIQSKAAPVVGGVVGGMAGLAIIAFLIWFFRRRRNQRRRSTLLTPLGTGRGSTFYEIDKRSVGPSSRSTKWKAQAGWQFERMGDTASGIKEKIASLGASLRTKVAGPRSDSPTVNLNRGNSQFIDGQIPQHSRTNSALSNTARTTTKDRFQDWLERFKDNAAVVFKRKRPQEPEDPFATARGMSEKQANLKAGTPDFSQLLNMDDRELQLQADRRRASLTSGSYASSNGIGSLGLDFTSTLDPFADPKVRSAQDPFADPRERRNSNPFADPITQPKATVSKENNYVADVRRSRGLSTDMTNRSIGTGISTGAGGWRPPSTAPASRYPSTIAPSRDSYRDTVFSTFSSNARKGKGRSDPFDLERPELWRRDPVPAMPTNNLTVGDRADTESILVGMERESAVPQPLTYGQPAPRVVSQLPGRHDSAATYESKYSSGVSLGGFGDPGPDVGPGSGASSLQQDYGYLQRSDSAASSVSSRGGVGKAR